MRTITDHKTNACNESIEVTADERDERYGNASHNYSYRYVTVDNREVTGVIQIQHGPVGEVGINGITNEVLLAIVIDRLRGFQSGPFACRENALALDKLEAALHWLHSRTREREARGVEGLNLK